MRSKDALGKWIGIVEDEDAIGINKEKPTITGWKLPSGIEGAETNVLMFERIFHHHIDFC